MLHRDSRQVSAVVGVELGQEGRYVGLGGAVGDEQGLGDGIIRAPPPPMPAPRALVD